ncbi:MAG: hypothetical protein Tsb0013_18760 [Phycisphaerales bacterium]
MRHALALITLLPLGACSERTSSETTPTQSPPADAEARYEPPPVYCDCELGSWVVAGRGRHLHLDIDCPEEFDHLDGRIEYTSAALRYEFDPALLGEGELPRLVRMTPGGRLYSPIAEPEPRTEATYRVEVATAAWMQRDIAFTAPYVLLGSNSNSAMRAMLQTAGLEVPASVLAGTGFFGEFPGIDQSPGEELPVDQWPAIGLPEGPRIPEGPLPDGWDAPGTIRPDAPTGTNAR